MSASGSSTATGVASTVDGHSAYPTAADVDALLTNAGMDTTGLDFTSSAGAGRRAFERETGRRMLAVSGTREYDPPTLPTGRLDLLTDLAALTSVTADGEELVEGTDYYLQPYNAEDDGLPYTQIRFYRHYADPLYWFRLKTIVVVGSWGFGATIPDDAWEAMCIKAAFIRLPQLLAGKFQGVVQWTETNGVSERYDEKPLTDLVGEWKTLYSEAVIRYQRQLGVF